MARFGYALSDATQQLLKDDSFGLAIMAPPGTMAPPAPMGAPVPQAAPAPRFSRTPPGVPSTPPVPGGDTDAVFADWGIEAVAPAG